MHPVSRTIDQPERDLLRDALVEREREMAALLGAVERLPDDGGLVVLAGEAGVGKRKGGRDRRRRRSR